MATKKRVANIADLTKIQKFYIAHHRSRDLKTLALDVGCSSTLVRAYLAVLIRKDERKKTEAERAAAAAAEAEANKPPDPGIQQIKAGDLFARNKNRGVVIMTSEAAQLGDATRKQHMSPRLAKNVHKIRPD